MSIKELEEKKAKGFIRDYKITSPPHTLSIPSGRIVTKTFKKQSSGLNFITNYLIALCQQNGLKLLEEYRFDPERRWRFDFAIESIKVAVEYEGGIFSANGGHTAPKHYTKDTYKYNRAAELGWTVYRFTALNYQDINIQIK